MDPESVIADRPGPALARRGLVALLLVGGLCCPIAGCEPLGTRTRRRSLESLLLERADHWGRSIRRAVAESLVNAEAEYSVDALLLIAVVEQESRFNLRAKSRKGALGLMQIQPATARDVAERHGIAYREAEDLYGPGVSLAIGAAYLAELKESFGTWELALTAYHRGPRNLRKAIEPGKPVRSRYAERVMRRYESLKALCHTEGSLSSPRGEKGVP